MRQQDLNEKHHFTVQYIPLSDTHKRWSAQTVQWGLEIIFNYCTVIAL